MIYEILDVQATKASVQKSPLKEEKLKRKRIQKAIDTRNENTKKPDENRVKNTSAKENKEYKTREHQSQKEQRNQNKNQQNNGSPRYDDFEFDGIVSAEGVLEMMPDGYGFLRHQIITISPLQMIFIFHNHKCDCLV